MNRIDAITRNQFSPVARRLTVTAAALIATLGLGLLTGCGDDDPVGATVDTASLRALHLSPDAPAVDIYLGGESPAVSGLEFPQGTGYLEVKEGTYSLAITAMDTPAANAVLTVPNLTLERGVSYTAVAFDKVSRLKPLALADDYQGLGDGNIRVRAIHTASAVGQVDIWNIPATGDPSPLYENVDFGVAGGYLDIPAGAYTLGFDVNNDATPDVVFSLPALPAGTVANVFAVSDANDGVFLLAQFEDGSTARINPN